MKPGRNGPCSCGSGKKFKHCCEGKTASRAPQAKIGAPSPAESSQLIALFNSGRYAELESSARLLVERYPDFATGWKLLGAALHMQGKDSLPTLRKTAELFPGHADAHNSLGNALQDRKQFSDAAVSYRRALKIKPDSAVIHYNLGNVLQELGQLDGAEASFRQALKLNPDLIDAHNNLGNLFKSIGKFDEALASYRRALKIKPDYAEAHYNLGIALKELGQAEGAIASYRRALEIKPDYAEAHNNLGIALHETHRRADAVASYRRALEIKPDYAEAYFNLGCVLKDLGQFEDAVASFRRALEIKPDYAEARGNLLFTLGYTTSHTPSYCLEQARQYGRIVAGKVGARFSAWRSAAQPKRLRVGLVSGDLRDHVVGYFLEGLLAHINPARVELFAYPTHPMEDELTARIRPNFSAWKPLTGKSDEAAARLIHADGVHILLDLSGHTGHNRLPVFAWKPAPVQASWLGYFATTGVAEMDYLLADKTGVPEALRQQFTESIWYLPDTRLCFTAPGVDLLVAPLPALSNGKITLGCFQNLAKVNDGVLAAWGDIFAALPDASLRMQCKQLGEPAQKEQLAERLRRYGITPERAALHGPIDRNGYLAAHAEVDFILDTFPYPGGTTTCEALWMGVPTLTLAGDSLLARQGASLLMAAGLKEWIATNKNEYVAKAIAMASDQSKLASLRVGLREQVLASPLFDAPRFARNFEDALWGMWRARGSQG